MARITQALKFPSPNKWLNMSQTTSEWNELYRYNREVSVMEQLSWIRLYICITRKCKVILHIFWFSLQSFEVYTQLQFLSLLTNQAPYIISLHVYVVFIFFFHVLYTIFWGYFYIVEYNYEFDWTSTKWWKLC